MQHENTYHEQYRPQFHFTAREKWLNDPNGLVYYDGEYHLFFQHQTGADWGPSRWGHAIKLRSGPLETAGPRHRAA